MRYAQYLSLVTGKPLTGEHVFQPCRVLVVSLEDDADELRRRILAARWHHGIELLRSSRSAFPSGCREESRQTDDARQERS